MTGEEQDGLGEPWGTCAGCGGLTLMPVALVIQFGPFSDDARIVMFAVVLVLAIVAIFVFAASMRNRS